MSEKNNFLLKSHFCIGYACLELVEPLILLCKEHEKMLEMEGLNYIDEDEDCDKLVESLKVRSKTLYMNDNDR